MDRQRSSQVHQQDDQEDPFGEDQEDFNSYALSLSEWTDKEADKYNALLDKRNREVPDHITDQEEQDQVASKDDCEGILDNSWFEEASLSWINLQEGDSQIPPDSTPAVTSLHQSFTPEKEGTGREVPECQDASTVSRSGDSLADIGPMPTARDIGGYEYNHVTSAIAFGGNLGAVPKRRPSTIHVMMTPQRPSTRMPDIRNIRKNTFHQTLKPLLTSTPVPSSGEHRKEFTVLREAVKEHPMTHLTPPHPHHARIPPKMQETSLKYS